MRHASFSAWFPHSNRNYTRYAALPAWIIGMGFIVAISVPSYSAPATPAATVLLPDQIDDPRELVAINGTVFFVTQANELWKSDGTATGTVSLRTSVGQSTKLTRPGQLTNVNGTLFFSGSGEQNTDYTLWKSDGTPVGTVQITSVNRPHLPHHLTNVNGTLFFTASDATGEAVWKSDGTAEGTQIVFRKAIGELIHVSGTLFLRQPM